MEVSISSNICNSCQCEIPNASERALHYKSEWHRYNVKRRCSDMPPIGYELFHEKLALMKAKQNEGETSAYQCPYTKRTFKSEAAYNHYLNSAAYRRAVEKHNYKKTKGKQPTQDEYDEDEEGLEDEQMTIAAAAADDDDEEEQEEMEVPEGDAPRKHKHKNLEDGPIPVGHSLFNTMDNFPDTKACLDYMLSKFGFYVPFVDFLVDLEGLLEYLGYKIGVGHVCIWCNRSFKTTQGVQTHMREMGHCMINLRLPSGAEDEDYFQFYEFSHNLVDDDEDDDDEEDEDAEEEEDAEDGDEENEYKTSVDNEGDTVILPSTYRVKLSKSERQFLREQKRVRTLQLLGKEVAPEVLAYVNGESDTLPGDSDAGAMTRALMPAPIEKQRALKEMHSTGELELTDGTLIGHRDYKHFYQQMKSKEKPSTGHPAQKFVIQKQLAAQYLALSIPGYARKREAKAQLQENNARNKSWLQHCVERGMQNNVLIKKFFRHQNPK